MHPPRLAHPAVTPVGSDPSSRKPPRALLGEWSLPGSPCIGPLGHGQSEASMPPGGPCHAQFCVLSPAPALPAGQHPPRPLIFLWPCTMLLSELPSGPVLRLGSGPSLPPRAARSQLGPLRPPPSRPFAGVPSLSSIQPQWPHVPYLRRGLGIGTHPQDRTYQCRSGPSCSEAGGHSQYLKPGSGGSGGCWAQPCPLALLGPSVSPGGLPSLPAGTPDTYWGRVQVGEAAVLSPLGANPKGV